MTAMCRACPESTDLVSLPFMRVHWTPGPGDTANAKNKAGTPSKVVVADRRVRDGFGRNKATPITSLDRAFGSIFRYPGRRARLIAFTT